MSEFASADFYISPYGNDLWSGRLPEPTPDRTDGPFATLHRAREALRTQNKPATIWLRSGDYALTESFTLSTQDSGTPDVPVRYCAYPNETPRILGGLRVSGFRSISDPEVIERLDTAAREHVVAVDLKTLGLSNFGQLRSRGFNRELGKSGFGQEQSDGYKKPAAHLELFFNGIPMTLARWPNDDFVTIAGYGQAQTDEHGGSIGVLEGGFNYEGDRPRRWKPSNDIWLHGYWAFDWANSYERVASIDLDQRLIKTAPPYGNYGFRQGNRFYFLNVLEELDSPGEYYLDRANGMLYFWPPAPLEGAEVLISVSETPLFSLVGVSHLVINGLTFEAGRAEGITIAGGENIRIENCRLCNLGTDAITIEGGLHHQVYGCEISATGDSGITIGAGDRQTLTPCHHCVENNHIYAIARWSRTYVPAVHLSGVGMRVAHNLIHDLPHMAIVYWGNDILIEYNHIHHVIMETGDAGAIYTGRDFTKCGNLIRYNYIHDTGGYGMGAMGVYLDDCVSGQTIYGNLFVRVQRAVMLGGGCDNRVENNIFVDCQPAIWVDARGLDPSPVWVNNIQVTMRQRYEAMKPHQSPYCERYPELLALELETYFEKRLGIPPLHDEVVRNICVGGKWLESSWHPDAHTYLTWTDNLTEVDPQFVDAVHGDYNLLPSSQALLFGFKPLPLDQIGLRPDIRTASTNLE